MARLIPDNALNQDFITLGEKKILRFLRDSLDDSCYVWYQPQLEQSFRPDIILYIPEIGLILYEVKDWDISKIKKANIDQWEIEGYRSSTSPLKQAKNYFYNLKKKLEDSKIFVQKEGKNIGKLYFPIACACVFPNIQKSDFEHKGFDKIINSNFCLFKDELEQFRESNSPKLITDKIKNHFSVWWQNSELTKTQFDTLRGILYPEIISEGQKERRGEKVMFILDEYQEQIAKSIAKDHNRIIGVAGSGKSLVLACKAKLLLNTKPSWKILLTCYNISLASQLKFYMDTFSKEEKIDYVKRLEIIHFHGLCSKYFKKYNGKWTFINQEQVFSSARFKDMNEAQKQAELDEMESSSSGNEFQRLLMMNKIELYDAILIDEAQDFHPSWLKSITLLLKGDTNFLLLAEDPNQKIYPRNFTYINAGINVIGKKPYVLPLGYRSTREIILPATKLVQKSKFDEFYKKFIEEQDSNVSKIVTSRKGTFPKIKIIKKYEDICDDIADSIELKIQEGYKYCDIGIIYLTSQGDTKVTNNQGDLFLDKNNDSKINYTDHLRAKFASKNIDYFWLSQNKQTKSNYDQFHDSVTISTIFSAKGLEFSIVYLIGIEQFPWVLRNERENASLLYVAMTRAKYELTIYSIQKNETTNELEKIIDELKDSDLLM